MAAGITVLKAAVKGRAVAPQNQAKPLPLPLRAKNTAGAAAAQTRVAAAKS